MNIFLKTLPTVLLITTFSFAAEKPEETREALQARLQQLQKQNAELEETNELKRQIKAAEQRQAELQKPEASDPYKPSQFVQTREAVKEAGKQIGKEVKHVFH